MNPSTFNAIQNGITNGRVVGDRALGSIYVFAAGNNGNGDRGGFAPATNSYDNVNYIELVNSRFTIAVAALDHRGIGTPYSNPGASLLVSAFGGNGEFPMQGLTSADVQGNRGYSGGDYTSSFDGTSAAAPQVSGVIALMLQANPNLSWRDVQYILVNTARKNDGGDPGWITNPSTGNNRITNGGGYHVNHRYGLWHH